ncbi:MAG: PEP-CTERM sorting domain-containing protein [Phycisphaeraceae bacterium]|nr:PEP-CTERM sorting domain-containing protein [Phycisphaeraceae bacterium]
MFGRKVWALLLAAGFAPAAWGALSSNIFSSGSSAFEGTGFGTGSEVIEPVIKVSASPLDQGETNPVQSWQFHPSYDLGKWIGTWAVSYWDDPRAAYALGNGVRPHNRSTVTVASQSTGIMEGVSFRMGVGTIMQAPSNMVAGAAKLDFDYFFRYWEGNPTAGSYDPATMDATPQILQLEVWGIMEADLPAYTDRFGPTNEDLALAGMGWTKLYDAPNFSSQQHGKWEAGTPIDGPFAMGLPTDTPTASVWKTLSDGVTVYSGSKASPTTTTVDGTFNIAQAYDYLYVYASLVTYSESHMNFWMLGGAPSSQLSVAIDNVTLQVSVGPSFIPGDFNGDGAVTLSDINPFKLALTDVAAWQAQFPEVILEDVDPNGDGVITLSDINPFKALLTGGSGAEVPEPASLSLLVVGALALARRR